MTNLDRYIENAKDENGYVRIERLIPIFGGRKSSGMMKEVMSYIKKNKIPYVIMDFWGIWDNNQNIEL